MKHAKLIGILIFFGIPFAHADGPPGLATNDDLQSFAKTVRNHNANGAQRNTNSLKDAVKKENLNPGQVSPESAEARLRRIRQATSENATGNSNTVNGGTNVTPVPKTTRLGR